MPTAPRVTSRLARPFGLNAFAGLALVLIAAVGLFVEAQFARRSREANGQRLEDAAQAQALAVAATMRERIGDASLFSRQPAVQAVLATPDGRAASAASVATLTAAARDLANTYGYHNIEIYDSALTGVAASGHSELVVPGRAAALRAAMRTRGPVVVPMHEDDSGLIEFGIAVPVFRPGIDSAVIGAVYTSMPAEQGLLADPRVGSLATGTRGISILQDLGDSVFVFRTLRQADGQLVTRWKVMPKDEARRASMSPDAPRPYHGMLRGMTIEGADAYAASVGIPGTPWFAVATVPFIEIEGPIRAVRIAGLMAYLLLAAVLLLLVRGAVARRREEMAALKAEVGERAVRVVQTSLDGFVALDRDGWVIEANEAASRMTGYSVDELLRLNLGDLKQLSPGEDVRAVLSRIEASNGIHYRSKWTRKDGALLEIDVSARYLADDMAGRIVAFIRDVGEDLRTQRRIVRSGELYRLLNRANKGLFAAGSPEEAFATVCDAIVEDRAFRLAWVAAADLERGSLRPVACAGVAAPCVNDLFRQIADQAGALQGLHRRALELGESVVVNDFRASAETAAWHSLAERHDIGSVAMLPIANNARSGYLLLVYHEARDYFDAETVVLITEVARFLSAVLAAQEAAETRRQEEARFRTIFEASPLPMIVIDERHGRVSRVNRAFTATFGWSLPEVSDTPMLMQRLYPDPDLRRVLAEDFTTVLGQLSPQHPTGTSPTLAIACKDGDSRVAQSFVTRIGHELLVAYVDLTVLRRSQDLAAEAQEIARLVSWEYDFVSDRLVNPSATLQRVLVHDGVPRSPLDLVVEEDRALVRAALDAAVRTHEPLDVTARLVVEGGAVRRYRTRMRIQFDAAGRPQRGIGSSQDVTEDVELRLELEGHRNRLQELVEARTAELEKALAQLRVTDRRLQAMFRLSQQAPAMSEEELLQLAVDEAERLTGSTAGYLHLISGDQARIEFNTWSTSARAQCSAEYLEHYPVSTAGIWADAVRSQSPVVHNEFAAATVRPGYPKGHVHLARHLVVPLVEQGRVQLVIGVGNKEAPYDDTDVQELQLIARDVWGILQRRRTEAALAHAYEEVAASDARFAFAMEASAEGIWDWDLVKNEVTYSTEYLKILGYAPGEFPTAGSAWGGFLHPDERERVLAQLFQDLRTDTPSVLEFRIRRKDGTYIWGQTRGRVMARDANGHATRAVGTFSDLTARRAAEEELRAAKVEADEANRAKSAFLALMSHEIRTPMNGVLGMAEVLSLSALPAREAEAVKTIRGSAATLLTLIDDILDFSKIEAGRLELDVHETDVHEMVEGIFATLAPVARNKRVELSLYVSPDLPRILLADSVRLRQIIFNLLGNAVKFGAGTMERFGRVSLRLDCEMVNPPCLRIAVQDDGIGISPDAQAKLFQTFSQAESSTTRRFGGTGLGLVITRRLAELMGGSISVQSALGEGATFTVIVPLEAAAKQPVVLRPELDGVRCLIVPAPRDFGEAKAVAAYARIAGATAQECASMAEARALAAAAPHTSVVLDWTPPGDITGGVPDDNSLIRHLRITHGQRRVPRVVSPNLVILDHDALREQTFLAAVAVAVGRASPEQPVQLSDEMLVAATTATQTVSEAREAGTLIVVAEDDEVNQRVILRQLELLGFAAEIAADGEEALALWRRGGCGLLITDLHMPKMDGYQLAAAIRAEEQPGEHVPIVALTANALRGEETRARDAGMDGYLTKPIRLVDLKREIQSRLNGELPSARAAAVDPVSAEAAAVAPIVEGPSGPSGPRRISPSISATAPALDVAVLQHFIGDDTELIDEFLAEYRRSAELHMAALQAAVKGGDLAQAGMSAHTLKSSSRTAGATRFGDLLAEVESAAKRHDAPAVAALLDVTLAEFARVQKFLDSRVPTA